ncbi:MAG: NEW3 domain-containing protein [Dehalococcoidia bacterium]
MRRLKRVGLSLVVVVFILSIAGVGPAIAQQPERDISVTTTYPHVVVPLAEAESVVQFSVTVANEGTAAEEVNLSASAPEGWKYQFESGYPKKIVRAVYLPPKEEDEENFKQELTLKVTPPSEVESRDYQFTVNAASEDGEVSDSVPITLTFSGEAAPSEPAGVELSTDSTTLEQTAGNDFEFSISVKNEGEESRRFEFRLEASGSETQLEGWTGYLTKGYESTRIQDLKIDAGSTETIKLHLDPPSGVQAGEYPVNFKASSGDVSDTIEVKAVITGTYELSLTAPEDGRLNTSATAGKATTVSLQLENRGSTALEDISFSALNMPEGWDVTFSPDSIDTFEADETRTIKVDINPGSNTIAGDYMIELKTSSSQSSDSVDYRVTVETPTAWGWVGVAIVVIVIAGLFAIFARVRRR